MLADGELLRELTAMLPGDADASLTGIVPGVYGDLRRLAASFLRDERPDHTFQPTALVHEAFIRMSDQRQLSWRNRAQLLALFARMMRRILLDYAAARTAAKRGGKDAVRIALDDALDVYEQHSLEIAALEEALQRLSALDPQQGTIVEMRFFGGLTVEEIAEVLNVSPATVKREWAIAKRWLRRELSSDA